MSSLRHLQIVHVKMLYNCPPREGKGSVLGGEAARGEGEPWSYLTSGLGPGEHPENYHRIKKTEAQELFSFNKFSPL